MRRPNSNVDQTTSTVVSPSSSRLTARPLSLCERLRLFDGTASTAEEASAYDDAEITFDLIRSLGCSPDNILTAGLLPCELSRRGAANAASFREAGFDAADLVDPAFAAQLIEVIGVPETIRTFVSDASDAVCVAGSDAVEALGLDVATLLMLCAGAPVEAEAVLSQMLRRTAGRQGGVLHGVDIRVLLDTGIRANALRQCGIAVVALAKATGATANNLSMLGYAPQLVGSQRS
jgi:hypothetical protein